MENNENMQFNGVNTTNSKNAKPIHKKWWFWVIIAVVAVGIISAAASSSNVDDQGDGTPSSSESGNSESQGNGNSGSGASQSNQNNLGDFKLIIKSCRIARDYEKKPIIIVKYEFTNNSDDNAAFFTTFDDNAYQNGVGLSQCYVAADSANYSSDNSMKEIKPGVTLEVEVAYVLNDSTTPVLVEVSEMFSFDDKTVTKTFNIE